MFKVGDRVIVLDSVVNILVGKVGTITSAGYNNSYVLLDNKDIHMYHTTNSGRYFLNWRLQLLKPAIDPDKEAEWE